MTDGGLKGPMGIRFRREFVAFLFAFVIRHPSSVIRHCHNSEKNPESFLNDPVVRRGKLDELGDGGLVQDSAFRGADVFPDPGQGTSGGPRFVARGSIGTVDRGENFSQRDRTRGPGEPVSSGCASGTQNEPRAFQLEKNLNKVAFGNPVSLGDVSNPHRGIFRTGPSQCEQSQTSVFRLRGDLQGNEPFRGRIPKV